MNIEFSRRQAKNRGFNLTLGAGVRLEIIDEKTYTNPARFVTIFA
jgi:hypothetical protein